MLLLMLITLQLVDSVEGLKPLSLLRWRIILKPEQKAPRTKNGQMKYTRLISTKPTKSNLQYMIAPAIHPCPLECSGLEYLILLRKCDVRRLKPNLTVPDGYLQIRCKTEEVFGQTFNSILHLDNYQVHKAKGQALEDHQINKQLLKLVLSLLQPGLH